MLKVNNIKFGVTQADMERAHAAYQYEKQLIQKKLIAQRIDAGISDVPEVPEKVKEVDSYSKQIKLELLDGYINQFNKECNDKLVDALSIIRSLIAPASYAESPSLGNSNNSGYIRF